MLHFTAALIRISNMHSGRFLECFIHDPRTVVLRKGAPMCDIELVAQDLHVLVANWIVQCAPYCLRNNK